MERLSDATRSAWPPNRMIECAECGHSQLPSSGWICSKCKASTEWGFETRICHCGTQIRGRRTRWKVNWFPCPGCDQDAAEKQAKVARIRDARDAKDRTLLLKLQVQRGAAAECFERNPKCKVNKRSSPKEPFCGACKGGVDA